MSDSDNGTTERAATRYWRRNIRCVALLLVIWFAVSYGCGILLADRLDTVRLPGTGFKLGFWFAQQGSIYVFVILIAVYVRYMNRLDREYAEDRIRDRDREKEQEGEKEETA